MVATGNQRLKSPRGSEINEDKDYLGGLGVLALMLATSAPASADEDVDVRQLEQYLADPVIAATIQDIQEEVAETGVLDEESIEWIESHPGSGRLVLVPGPETQSSLQVPASPNEVLELTATKCLTSSSSKTWYSAFPRTPVYSYSVQTHWCASASSVTFSNTQGYFTVYDPLYGVVDSQDVNVVSCSSGKRVRIQGHIVFGVGDYGLNYYPLATKCVHYGGLTEFWTWSG